MSEIPQDLAEWAPEKLIELASKKGEEFFKGDVTTAQLRNFFALVNSIRQDYRNIKREGKASEAEWALLKRRLILLHPRLAYAVGRNKKLRAFQETMKATIDSVSSSIDFERALENFFTFVEAIVAYHKFHGGKDN